MRMNFYINYLKKQKNIPSIFVIFCVMDDILDANFVKNDGEGGDDDDGGDWVEEEGRRGVLTIFNEFALWREWMGLSNGIIISSSGRDDGTDVSKTSFILLSWVLFLLL